MAFVPLKLDLNTNRIVYMVVFEQIAFYKLRASQGYVIMGGHLCNNIVTQECAAQQKKPRLSRLSISNVVKRRMCASL